MPGESGTTFGRALTYSFHMSVMSAVLSEETNSRLGVFLVIIICSCFCLCLLFHAVVLFVLVFLVKIVVIVFVYIQFNSCAF